MSDIERVQPGDLVTAQLINDLIAEVESLRDRVQQLEDSSSEPTLPDDFPTFPQPWVNYRPEEIPPGTFSPVGDRSTFVQPQDGGGRPGQTVLEVEGIGREEAGKLAEEGVFTLNALATESPNSVKEKLSVGEEEAERIVKEAYKLSGGQTGDSLLEVSSIGREKKTQLNSAGISDLQALSGTTTETVKNALDIDDQQANSLISGANNVLGSG